MRAELRSGGNPPMLQPDMADGILSAHRNSTGRDEQAQKNKQSLLEDLVSKILQTIRNMT